MKQVKINDILYVMDTEAYAITADTDASIIYVPEDYYDAYVALNSGLTLTKYNYGVIRITKPEYDVPEPPEPPTPTQKYATITFTLDVEEESLSEQYTLIPFGMDPTTHNPVPKVCSEHFSKVEIDGTEIDMSILDESYGLYTFTDVGQHTIKFTSLDDTIEAGIFADNEYSLCYNTLVISEDTTSIGVGAFLGIDNITTVTIEATTPPTVGIMAFKDRTNNVYPTAIYVPSASIDLYRNASDFSDYVSIIQPIE